MEIIPFAVFPNAVIGPTDVMEILCALWGAQSNHERGAKARGNNVEKVTFDTSSINFSFFYHPRVQSAVSVDSNI